MFSRAIAGATLDGVFSCPAWAAFTGKVLAVAHGNTLSVLVARQQLKVRVAEIEALALGLPITTHAIMWFCNDAYGGTIA